MMGTTKEKAGQGEEEEESNHHHLKAKWRSHQTPCKGRRSARTTWEGGALGGVGGRKEPATSNTAGASSWLVAHPAVVVNINMETRIIFSTSPLYQAPLQLATHALQPYALKQGGACEVFPQEFEFENLMPDRRLWWPIYWQGGGGK